ncbi:hypothetical protein EV356DRAFT_471125 [Viridothelium virens]|uniref:Zn(2)-C6 fungal-type domain-containing protein n=1 Tax=Viridothelium virens TaxID=1048519 RepID=A0A6A6H1S2_VIRVR|nr:hypothetical protein EV356DRAFT_471125 [Viridothelium virens]
MSDSESSSEIVAHKRKRTSRACDCCRRKKIRCDPTTIPCENCIGHGTQCVFTRVNRPRKTPRKNAGRLDDLEACLSQIEILLRQSHPAEVNGGGRNAQSASFVMKNSDAEVTNSSSLKRPHRLGNRTLPPRADVQPMIIDFFEGYNHSLPLFQPALFMQSLEEEYTQGRQENPARRAVVSIVLALSMRLNPNHDIALKNRDRAWKCAQHAFDDIPTLMMRQTDLMTVQALLGMAIFLHGTPNPRPASVLVAAAIRLAFGLGMQRRRFDSSLSPAETQQRLRVWWVAYCLDKDFSLRFEQPSMINDDDMDVELPELVPEDQVGLMITAEGRPAINLFRLRVHLAVIQSKAYLDLYSVRALEKSEEESLCAMQNLDDLLTEWNDCLPTGLDADNLVTSVNPGSRMPLMMLHLLYFNCLTIVHRVSFQNQSWTKFILHVGWEDLGDVPHRQCLSALRCLEAARASLRLMELAPQGDYACTWILLSYSVSAIIILFARMIHEPTHDSAQTDMDLIRPQIRLLNSFAEDQHLDELKNMRELCNELARRADNALNMSQQPTAS